MVYLGVDIGGSGARLRLVPGPRDEGRLTPDPLEERLVWADGNEVEDDLARLETAIDDLTGGDPRRVDALGVARPASVDAHGIVTAWPNRPSWVGCSFPSALTRLCPSALATHEDDGNAAARAEASAAGSDHLAYLGMGTGVAGGIVVDGKVVGGRYGGAGEVGHLPVASSTGTARCSCGRAGCLQATVSRAAVSERVARRTGSRHTIADLPVAVRAGAPWALNELTTVAGALTDAVQVLVELIAPQQVRIGGGLSTNFPGLCAQVIEGLALRPGRAHPTVGPALHGEHSSLAGAVLLARSLTTTDGSDSASTAEEAI